MPIRLIRELREQQEIGDLQKILGVPEEAMLCLDARLKYINVCGQDAYTEIAEEKLHALLNVIKMEPKAFEGTETAAEIGSGLQELCSRLKFAVESGKTSDCLDRTGVEQEVDSFLDKVSKALEDAYDDTGQVVAKIVAGVLIYKVLEWLMKRPLLFATIRFLPWAIIFTLVLAIITTLVVFRLCQVCSVNSLREE